MIVIRDTREQKGHGWTFGPSDGFSSTKIATMKSGDYTLEGYEGLFSIERKGSILEVAQNLTQNRFENELKRLSFLEHTFIVCEFDMYEIMTFPQSAKVSWNVKASIKITPTYILKRINEFQLKYPTKWIFAGSYGHKITCSIFKRIMEMYDPAE